MAVGALWLGGAVAGVQIGASARSLAPAAAIGRYAGPLPPRTAIALYIALPGSHDDELEGLLLAQQTPGSPFFQRYLTPDQFGRYFGANPLALGRAVAVLRAAGFSIDRIVANRRDLEVHAPAATVEAFFRTPLDVRSDGGRAFFTARFAPEISAALDGAAVYGLDSYPRMRPHHVSFASRVDKRRGWGPPDIQSTYDLMPIYPHSTAKGIVVADATVGFARTSDFTAFAAQFGLGASLVSVPVGSSIPNDNNGETTLDVEWIAGVAPDATIDQVSPENASDESFDSMYSYIVNSLSSVHIVSTSWGVCEQQTGSDRKLEESLFAQASAEGQWWLAASGDDGSDDCENGRRSVDFPGSSPHVVSVGGTEVTPRSTNANHYAGWKSEVTWAAKGDGASGGGKSVLFSKPPFQALLTPADGARDVPDVALMADDFDRGGYLVFFRGRWENGWGGTSFAAPMWAGFLALVAGSNGGTIVSPLHQLYRLAATSVYRSLFHDITKGCNTFRKVRGYCAARGYDQTTGLGSFIGARLASAY